MKPPVSAHDIKCKIADLDHCAWPQIQDTFGFSPYSVNFVSTHDLLFLFPIAESLPVCSHLSSHWLQLMWTQSILNYTRLLTPLCEMEFYHGIFIFGIDTNCPMPETYIICEAMFLKGVQRLSNLNDFNDVGFIVFTRSLFGINLPFFILYRAAFSLCDFGTCID